MDPFIYKLREYGLALRCITVNENDLAETPLFVSETSTQSYLHYLTNKDFTIIVNNEEMFKDKFQLETLFGKRPSFFLGFFYLEFNDEENELKLYNDTTFSYVDEIIESFVEQNEALYEEQLREYRICSLFDSTVKPHKALTEYLINEINNTCYSDLVKPVLAELQQELTSALETVSKKNLSPL